MLDTEKMHAKIKTVYLNKYLRGEKQPKPPTIEKLAKVFGLKAEDLQKL